MLDASEELQLQRLKIDPKTKMPYFGIIFGFSELMQCGLAADKPPLTKAEVRGHSVPDEYPGVFGRGRICGL